jgi:Collagen triple helix repeat (20 copies)
MFKQLRRHLTPSTFIAFLALVFALTGGAFAASSSSGGSGARGAAPVALASISKAKKKAAPKSTRGPAGPKGATGAAGAAGLAGAMGPAGAAGPAGATGPAGAVGPAGPTGAAGPVGPAGPEGSFDKTLPAGKTETGVWGVSTTAGSFAGGALQYATAAISFSIPLGAAVAKGDVHILAVGAEGTGNGSGCPVGSSAAKPAAEAGNLCIFESSPQVNLSRAETRSLETEEEGEAGTTGALLKLEPEHETEPILASGVWAVTAE